MPVYDQLATTLHDVLGNHYFAYKAVHCLLTSMALCWQERRGDWNVLKVSTMFCKCYSDGQHSVHERGGLCIAVGRDIDSPLLVLLVVFGDVVGERIVWVGRGEQSLDGEQDGSNLKGRGPLVLEYV